MRRGRGRRRPLRRRHCCHNDDGDAAQLLLRFFFLHGAYTERQQWRLRLFFHLSSKRNGAYAETPRTTRRLPRTRGQRAEEERRIRRRTRRMRRRTRRISHKSAHRAGQRTALTPETGRQRLEHQTCEGSGWSFGRRDGCKSWAVAAARKVAPNFGEQRGYA